MIKSVPDAKFLVYLDDLSARVPYRLTWFCQLQRSSILHSRMYALNIHTNTKTTECKNWAVTGQFTDKPNQGQVNSRTSQLAEMSDGKF